jgi:hypothetical protein
LSPAPHQELDEKLGLWVAEQHPSLEGAGLSLDGKTLCGSRDGERKGVHLLSAVVHGSGVVVAQMRVSDKTNEIPCVKPLLAELNITARGTLDVGATKRSGF